MNAGIQDALFLAGKLADVLSLGADVSVLGDYEKERRPVALTVLRITERLAGVATLRGEAGQKFRNRLMRALGRLPAFRRALAARLSGFAGSKRSLAVPNEKRRLLLTALILAALVGFVLFASVER